MKGAIAAIVALLVMAVAGAATVAATGAYNVAADAPHAAIFRDFLSYVRKRSIAARAADVTVPRLDDRKTIGDGAADYDAMCTGCHLAPGMPENEMRPGMNPKPPLLANGDFGTPAQAFWTIKHGVKMTGMPAWGATHSDAEIWNMVAFLEVLPHLSPVQYRAVVASGGEHHDRDHMDMPH